MDGARGVRWASNYQTRPHPERHSTDCPDAGTLSLLWFSAGSLDEAEYLLSYCVRDSGLDGHTVGDRGLRGLACASGEGSQEGRSHSHPHRALDSQTRRRLHSFGGAGKARSYSGIAKAGSGSCSPTEAACFLGAAGSFRGSGCGRNRSARVTHDSTMGFERIVRVARSPERNGRR